MGKFENIYILSDMDGTLIGSNHEISKENIEAINYFTKNGGTFGVATGRDENTVKFFIEGIDINGLSIVSNGSVIFDIATGEVVYSGGLNREEIIPFAKKIIAQHPTIGVQVYTRSGLFISDNAPVLDDYIIIENVKYTHCDISSLESEQWNKILFHSDDHAILRDVERQILETFHGSAEMNYSSEFYYEIMPLHHTKGDSLKRIASMEKYRGKKFIACGDHLNDVNMLREADVAICPSNAREGAKAVCDMESVSCDEHLLREIVAMLEDGRI